MLSFCLLLLMVILSHSISFGKELPKIAVWDLTSGDIKGAYAQDLTLILASEVSKLGKYEVYSQENVRTLAGWTAERMQLGCTDTKCLTALGQMDIAKLISGRVGKIGNRYTISLNLFDTQNARSENSLSKFCTSEDELIELVQQTVRELLGEAIRPPGVEEKRVERKGDEKTFTNSIAMEFALIPAGRFMMGSKLSPEEVVKRWGEKKIQRWFSPEHPRHEVIISKAFYIGTYEVTQAQWQAVMGSNPSQFRGDDRPVEQVSWSDAKEFVRRLNEKEGTNRYRLPTEAEWEYACRAGSTTLFHYGDDQKPNLRLGDYAWYEENSGHKAHRVGQKKPNGFGLYDMYGNVEEWCADWYALYQEGELTDPSGPTSGQTRILRGGNCGHPWDSCRSARRNNNVPHYSSDYVGFRVVLDPK